MRAVLGSGRAAGGRRERQTSAEMTAPLTPQCNDWKDFVMRMLMSRRARFLSRHHRLDYLRTSVDNCWSSACASPLSCHLSCLGSRRTDRQLETSGHVGVACGEGMHGLTPVRPQHRRTTLMCISIGHAVLSSVLSLRWRRSPQSSQGTTGQDRASITVTISSTSRPTVAPCSILISSHPSYSLLTIPRVCLPEKSPSSADSAPNTQLLHLRFALPLSVPHQPCCIHDYCATLHVVHLAVRAVKATLRCLCPPPIINLPLPSPYRGNLPCPTATVHVLPPKQARVALRCAVMVSQ
jgi:hypothetical protein